ncbi:AI-2E family transporter, partial [Planctomycetota bacterium]
RRHGDGGERPSVGQFFVEGIFGSGWLPRTDEESREGAREILDTIAAKLQTWVKGYLWIIIIETCVYTILFLLVGVPYAYVLGPIAGLTILLPFLGPLASAILTAVVCLATGAASGMSTVALIAGIYLVMNGVIEQLFLYPAFVGEALGLNVIETIIVVLLGGLFAGLAGVIFAVPVASVLKYLIPRVYQTWLPQPATPTAAAT